MKPVKGIAFWGVAVAGVMMGSCGGCFIAGTTLPLWQIPLIPVWFWFVILTGGAFGLFAALEWHKQQSVREATWRAQGALQTEEHAPEAGDESPIADPPANTEAPNVLPQADDTSPPEGRPR